MRDRHAIRRRIESLDPVRDCHRVSFLSASHDFPRDTEIALALAFFRTFAVPSIAAILDATGQFARAGQMRYDDTTLLLAEFLEHGPESARGRAAIRRINRIHGEHAISNEDYLYVLTTFIFEPVRWNARYGWRPLTAGEKLAGFHLWRRVGELMGIANLPETYEAMEAFNLRFERERFRRTPASERLGTATLAIATSRLPAIPGLRRLALHAVSSILDRPVREAMGFPEPHRAVAALVHALLRLRAQVLRTLWPPRRAPYLVTTRKTPTYPGGYSIDTLGPPVGPASSGPPGPAPGTHPAPT
jgi:hypothetical protein